MSMLEKLAARVREQGGIATLSCEVCACKPRNSERCTQHSCPQEQAPDGALMLTRWAVKLVAEGLEEELAGYVENGWASDLADKLLDLITEAEASASEKQAEEVPDGR